MRLRLRFLPMDATPLGVGFASSILLIIVFQWNGLRDSKTLLAAPLTLRSPRKSGDFGAVDSMTDSKCGMTSGCAKTGTRCNGCPVLGPVGIPPSP